MATSDNNTVGCAGCNVSNYAFSTNTFTTVTTGNDLFRAFEVFLVVVISLASVVGNGLVLVAFVKLRRLRTSINVFILNLAVADITFGLILPGIVPNILRNG